MIDCGDDILINNTEDIDLDDLNDDDILENDYDETEDVTNDELKSILSNTNQSKASARRSSSKIITKGPVKKLEPIKTVDTENSIENKNKAVEKYYKKLNKSTPNNDEKSIDVGNNVPFNEVEKLKEVIKLFLHVDTKCNELTEEMKTTKMERKQYEDHILNFMGEYEKEKIPCDNAVLRREVKRVKPKPKEDDIKNTLTDILKDADLADNITKRIFESVPDEEKISLKKDEEKKANPVKKGKKQVKI